MKKRLGLHIRIQSSFAQLLEKMEHLDIPFFQCFFVTQATGKLITITPQEENYFLHERRRRFQYLFCHGSYWINLASLGNNGYRSLLQEIALAKRLEFTHFVLHAGTAKGAVNKSQGIDALAFCLNSVIKKERDIVFLLENTCHGNLAVGSDITDFKQVLEKIDKPERIGFCIDTAHAYSFGYKITDQQSQLDFIRLLDATLGLDRIKLIHLNDSAESFSSRIDRHAVFGKGKIGFETLVQFAQQPLLQHIPIILEMPELALEEEKLILKELCK